MSRYILVIVAVLVAALPAMADENPNARLFFTFDSTGYSNEIASPPDPNPFNMYLCLDELSTGARAVALTATCTIGGFSAGVPTYPIAGTNVIGAFNSPSGWAIAWANCEAVDAGTGILVVAQVPWFYTGDGTVTITAHPTETHKVIGCNFVADQYCTYQNLGVGVTPPPGDEGCDSPVEAESWGAIKAMFR